MGLVIVVLGAARVFRQAAAALREVDAVASIPLGSPLFALVITIVYALAIAGLVGLVARGWP